MRLSSRLFKKVMSIAVIALLLLLELKQSLAKISCTDSGPCLKCSKDKMTIDYCLDTGRKMKQTCYDRGVKFDDYRVCQLTAEDDQLRVFFFQAVMAICGGLAFWGVLVRKQAHMSLFDSRKQQSNLR